MLKEFDFRDSENEESNQNENWSFPATFERLRGASKPKSRLGKRRTKGVSSNFQGLFSNKDADNSGGESKCGESDQASAGDLQGQDHHIFHHHRDNVFSKWLQDHRTPLKSPSIFDNQAPLKDIINTVAREGKHQDQPQPHLDLSLLNKTVYDSLCLNMTPRGGDSPQFPPVHSPLDPLRGILDPPHDDSTDHFVTAVGGVGPLPFVRPRPPPASGGGVSSDPQVKRTPSETPLVDFVAPRGNDRVPIKIGAFPVHSTGDPAERVSGPESKQSPRTSPHDVPAAQHGNGPEPSNMGPFQARPAGDPAHRVPGPPLKQTPRKMAHNALAAPHSNGRDPIKIGEFPVYPAGDPGEHASGPQIKQTPSKMARSVLAAPPSNDRDPVKIGAFQVHPSSRPGDHVSGPELKQTPRKMAFDVPASPRGSDPVKIGEFPVHPAGDPAEEACGHELKQTPREVTHDVPAAPRGNDRVPIKIGEFQAHLAGDPALEAAGHELKRTPRKMELDVPAAHRSNGRVAAKSGTFLDPPQYHLRAVCQHPPGDPTEEFRRTPSKTPHMDFLALPGNDRVPTKMAAFLDPQETPRIRRIGEPRGEVKNTPSKTPHIESVAPPSNDRVAAKTSGSADPPSSPPFLQSTPIAPSDPRMKPGESNGPFKPGAFPAVRVNGHQFKNGHRDFCAPESNGRGPVKQGAFPFSSEGHPCGAPPDSAPHGEESPESPTLVRPQPVFKKPLEPVLQNKTVPLPPPARHYLHVNGKPYNALSLLGRGGSSEVYQVLDPENSTLLAIKCVNLSTVDPAIATGYLNEIDLLSKLQGCSSVIRMIDHQYISESKMLYVVMEKGDIDLSKLMRDITKTKEISISMIIYYWTEMLTAVKEIHERGIIHSDLKPANFLLVSGRLKLIDFGIASTIQEDMTSVTKEFIAGTYNYISPEAIRQPGEHIRGCKISCKSDIWSLGCILYNMIYGRTPFSHITKNWVKLEMIADPEHRVELPPGANTGADVRCIPAELELALEHCLRKDPRRRPTAAQLLALPYHSEPTPDAHPLMHRINALKHKCVTQILEGGESSI